MSRCVCGAVAALSVWMLSGSMVVAQPGDAAPTNGSGVVASTNLRERTLEMLEGFAFDENPLLRANAIEALLVTPSRVEPIATAALNDENPGVRFAAAMAVGKLQMRDSSAQVRPLLRDEDARVRCAAIYALTRCGEAVDRTSLAAHLLGNDLRASSTAAFVLGELGDPSAIALLRDVARPPRRRDAGEAEAPPQGTPDPVERVIRRLQVAEALVKLGDESARDVVRSALYPRQREDFEAAVLAAQILGELKDQTAVAQLVQLVEQTVSQPEGEAKGESAGGGDVTYLQPKELRLSAATALAKMGYRDGVYVAEAYKNDPDPTVRAQAAFLFRACGRPQERAVLEAMLDDPSPLVQVSAAAGVLAIMER